MCVDLSASGVVGNGTADDTAALQSALNTAQTTGQPLCLKPGNIYRISGTLTVPDQVTILGRGARILVAPGAEIGAVLSIAASNVTVDNLYIEASAPQGANKGIFIDGGSFVEVRQCQIMNTAEAGIALRAATDCAVIGNRLVACGRPQKVNGTQSYEDHGIMIYTETNAPVSGIVVERNTVIGSNRKGITTYSATTGVISAISIRGNLLRGNKLGGIFVSTAPTSARMRDIVVSDNRVIDNVGSNIEVDRTDGATIAGNVSHGSDKAVVVVASSEVAIIGNVIRESGVDGILITNGGDASAVNRNITVSGNTIFRPNQTGYAFGAGIVASCVGGATIVGNTIGDDGGRMVYGVLIEPGTAGNDINASTANNTIYGFGTGAIVTN